MSIQDHYIGVDVGTGSVRASLLSKDGTIVASSTQTTQTWRDDHDHRIFEQSTTDIWSAISKTIKSCLEDSNVSAEQVKGLGFDATCSLAVADLQGEPVIVTKGNDLGLHGERNIILWADHRAEKEAELINGTGSVVLDYVGGRMSLEMEVPKILWLKKNMPADRFPNCQFFDLPDFLTYRATRDSTRSCCSVTCKCSFVPKTGWHSDFFKQIGLGQLVMNNYLQLGAEDGNVLTAGTPIGTGLSKQAAQELGLVEGTPVGSALIDAYAGWIGTVAARYKKDGILQEEIPDLEESGHRLAVIAGTSTCHIVQSRNDIFVDGVWGPYKDPVFRGWWMNEGGQSSTGQLIDFILTTHPAYPKLEELAKEKQKNIHEVLDEVLEQLRVEEGVSSLTELTKDLHIYPDFHGNRSPIADPRMRGSITGLELSSGIPDLAKKYNATLESIALQTRHIISVLNSRGHTISSIYMSGGQAKNIKLMQLFADVCDMPVVLPQDPSAAVDRGAAILGRFAAEGGGKGDRVDQAKELWKVMIEMTPPGTLVVPSASPKDKKLLNAKFRIFMETVDIQRRWRVEMEEAARG
ncbi:hypothetical protein AGABI2DRAFT_202125 [Agaricus bisporus var. bisporus H97]|uniref:hypothetical protein n=1 Tax=Agaricus bisporus var. bisporus (strain H97 / ATCC MYA-4626 / FGSC 10389) TaxID=936046 RepID=UPI00029F5D83|nr:hypothetical protein AGABI2DRAFT_202125 [Agaricus bisporus var. bisporus H97]EKV47881.1 hypothetical protein AGABI2DRAFT_202125 [Agaricus bisporus var. bisporus H97]